MRDNSSLFSTLQKPWGMLAEAGVRTYGNVQLETSPFAHANGANLSDTKADLNDKEFADIYPQTLCKILIRN